MASKSKVDYKVERAIRKARRIRSELLRIETWKEDQDLAGACGLASILLSIALKDVEILRRNTRHVWTEVNGTIIDITASQFNDFTQRDVALNGVVSGVLVTKVTKTYHLDIIDQGLRTYLSVVNNNWYNEGDHPNWKWISEYWL